MMAPAPESQHHWLQRLIGDWTYSCEVAMKPGESPVTMTGTESIRSLGDLWILAEGSTQAPDGTPGATLLTLGYDPAKSSFVGTWIGSMMTTLWVYTGRLEGDSLILDTVGPDHSDPAQTRKYQETITLKGDDHRVFSSAVQNDDGSWNTMMTIEYRRVK